MIPTATDDPPARPATKRAPRVRPVTWLILAGMLIATAMVLGAWQGSASRLGAVPAITVASDTGSVTLPPYLAADLGGREVASALESIPARDGQTLYVRLPAELRRSSLDLIVERGGGIEQRRIPAGSTASLSVPVTTPAGRVTHVAIRGLPRVYDTDGGESVLSGEWAFAVVGTSD